jgi:hypothetical protein
MTVCADPPPSPLGCQAGPVRRAGELGNLSGSHPAGVAELDHTHWVNCVSSLPGVAHLAHPAEKTFRGGIMSAFRQTFAKGAR